MVLRISDQQNLADAQGAVTATDEWHVTGAPLKWLYVVFVAMFALVVVAAVIGYRTHFRPANDYFAFKSFSGFIHSRHPAAIYDQDMLRNFQNLPQHKLFPFMYHPGMMLLLWPLADVPYQLGYALWIGVGLVACCIAVAGTWKGWPLAALVLVAPSTLWTGLCGQSSLLVAALLVGGLAFSPRQPVLGGVLLGLAAYKPQLGLLVPVALIAAGRWRAVLAAAATGLCIILVSTLAFGADVWPAWFHHLSSILEVRTIHRTDWAPLLATVGSNLTMAGVGRRSAELMQFAACAAAMLCVWRCYRDASGTKAVLIGEGAGLGDGAERLRIAALGTATFLATPYAFVYDLPLFTAALLLFVDERRRCGGSFQFREVLVLVAALLLPCLVLTGPLQMGSSLVVLALLCTILHRLSSLPINQDPVSRPAFTASPHAVGPPQSATTGFAAVRPVPIR